MILLLKSKRIRFKPFLLFGLIKLELTVPIIMEHHLFGQRKFILRKEVGDMIMMDDESRII